MLNVETVGRLVGHIFALCASNALFVVGFSGGGHFFCLMTDMSSHVFEELLSDVAAMVLKSLYLAILRLRILEVACDCSEVLLLCM